MKIVHVIGYYPPHLGGMELRTKDLSENFTRRGYEVEVFTSEINCKNADSNPTKNLKIHFLKSFEFAHTPIIPTLFFRLLSIPKNSVVHLHIAQAYIPEITFLVCKLRKIPYLAHVHLDVEATGSWGFLLPLYKKYICYPIVRRANVITVLTDDYKKLMANNYKVPDKKIVVIPNGTYFSSGNSIKTKVHKPCKILFAGRLSPQKNIPLLLNAVSICIHNYKIPVELSIVGEGEKKLELKELTKKLKIVKNVKFLGGLNYPRLQRKYRTADIFVLPSTSESFGSVVVESMASGTPVIATLIPAVKNIIKDGHNGLLVKNDPKLFANTIKTLITKPALYRKLVRNGLTEAKKYNWNTVTNKYESLYRRLSLMTKR